MRSQSNQHSLQILTLLMLILITLPGKGGTAFAQNTASERPRIGLALSGGARGGAHIGVLKVLEREHVPIDYIAGIRSLW